MKDKRRRYWWACCTAMVLLSLLTFTPLVSPEGVSEPLLAGMPRTLWAGILVTIGFVVLTFIGTRVYPLTAEEGHDA